MSVDPMLTTGDIPVITPEPDALSHVFAVCQDFWAACAELMLRWWIPPPRYYRFQTLQGDCQWQGIRGVVIVWPELVSLLRQ